ncbi:MAG: hypothetical protein HYZ73_03015 [Elusimicrobia bacterium]|nr:hypothetical protein [Elusimicrobiota bacterium]
MQKWWLRATGGVVLIGLGIVGGWVLAHAAGFQWGAFFPSLAYEEKVTFEDGGRETRFILPRQSVHIPRAYGRLVTVTGASTLWFESEDGTIRNVIVTGGLVAIQRKGDLELRH